MTRIARQEIAAASQAVRVRQIPAAAVVLKGLKGLLALLVRWGLKVYQGLWGLDWNKCRLLIQIRHIMRGTWYHIMVLFTVRT